MPWATATAELKHGDFELGAPAFGRAAEVFCLGHVICGDRAGDQREIQDALFPMCRDRARQAPRALRYQAAEGGDSNATESPVVEPPQNGQEP